MFVTKSVRTLRLRNSSKLLRQTKNPAFAGFFVFYLLYQFTNFFFLKEKVTKRSKKSFPLLACSDLKSLLRSQTIALHTTTQSFVKTISSIVAVFALNSNGGKSSSDFKKDAKYF